LYEYFKQFFVKHLNQTLTAEPSATKFTAIIVLKCVPPKVTSKFEILLKKPLSVAELSNKSSNLVVTLGRTHFITIIDANLVALCSAAQVTIRCSTNWPLIFEASLLNKGSNLAAALGVTIFITVIIMNLVTLCTAA
jgi:hypothetical protein